MKITYANRQQLDVHEYEVHKWSAEASTLGIRPGQWPVAIETELGNGLPFRFSTKEIRDGELLWVDYFQGNGCIWLRIYND
jgi:hypothetical protein